jgi:alcohol dehydrogenase YqhD (iron-dependent ADH family)
MNDFVFSNSTKVYFGKNQLQNLPKEIKAYGDKVLLVYGGGSIKRMGLYDKVMQTLKEAGIEVYELAGIEPNPRHTSVNAGAKICRENGIQSVLGIGGGSCIDASKAIAAAACYEGDVWDLVEGKAPVESALAVFAMPTMASTGSEMDKGAVISNIERNEKKSLSCELIRPKASFLDPTNTFSVSAYQTACGGFDIMSHFLEMNYFTKDENYALQKGVIESILRTLVKYIPEAIENPNSYEARSNLLWAASWALNSFCTSGMKQAPSCHRMEHELSAFYDLTHGLGLAILYPKWMEYLLDKDETVAQDFADFGVRVFGLEESTNAKDGAVKSIEAMKKFLYEDLGLKSTLGACQIDDAKFDAMAENACGPNGINGYRSLDEEDVKAIYRMCL